ncbi:MAG: NTP transferase domain-containing protein [Dehalococcoidia bacterium]|nr:NTP transferase domain-containing protein [Dehalococcoidia bacterium]
MYALVLAGGKGERLRPHTDAVPKPMVPINGRPLLDYHVAWLLRGGVTDIVFLTRYLAGVIEDHFGDGSAAGFRAHYSVEDHPLGRGGAMKQGYGLVPAGERTVIGTNGDVITEQPLRDIVARHEEASAAATVMLTSLVSPYGLVETDDAGMIRDFREKPVLPYWLNAGVYALTPAFFDLCPEEGDHEDSAFPELARRGQLAGFKSEHYWQAVDSIKDLNAVSERLAVSAR